MFGAFTYVGADLHLRFGVSFTLVGLIVGSLRHRRLDLQPVGAACWSTGSARSALPPAAASLLALAFVTLAVEPDWLDRAARHHRHRARLLHAAQHAADQRHADDAGSARHRGRDLLLRALSRTDRGRRRRRRRSSTASPRCRCSLAAALVLPALACGSRASSSAARSADSLARAGRARRARSRPARCARPARAGCRRART